MVGDKLRLTALEIDIAGGVWRSTSDPAGLPAVAKRSSTKGSLCVLVDVQGQQGDLVTDDLRSAVAGGYYRDSSRSVTSSIIRALQSVNEQLYAENQAHIRAERHYATLSCVVLRDSGAYFAQTEQGFACLIREGQLEQVGELVAARGAMPSGIGAARVLEIDLHHRKAEPGDTLILGSVDLAAICGSEELADVALEPSVDGAAERLVALIEQSGIAGDFRVLVLRLEAETRGSRPATPRGRAVPGNVGLSDVPPGQNERSVVTRGGNPLARRQRFGEESSGASAPAAQPRLRGSRVFSRSDDGEDRSTLPASDSPEAPVVARSRSLPSEEKITGDISEVSWARRKRAEARQDSRSPRDVSTARLDRENLADESDLQAGDRLVLLLESAGQTMRRAAHLASRVGIILLFALIVVLVAFALVYLPVRVWRDQQSGGATASLLERAEQKEQDALAAEDPATRARLLGEAYELAVRSAAVRRGDPFAEGAVIRIQVELDQIAGIVRLDAPLRLLALNSRIEQMMLVGADVYLLESAGGRVHRYSLTPNGRGIDSAGSPVLPADSAIERLVWVPSGSSRLVDGLLAIDRTGNLLEWDASDGFVRLELWDAEDWREARVLDGYAGSVYVLNPGRSSLLWYPPGPNGYDRPPHGYLHPDAEVDLSEAVDLVVGEEVYILNSGGHIDRFSAGRSRPFVGVVPDKPLLQPGAMAVGRRSVYVVDEGNQRIVCFDRGGEFQWQYRLELPMPIDGLAVDDDRGLLYAHSQNALYLYSVADIVNVGDPN